MPSVSAGRIACTDGMDYSVLTWTPASGITTLTAPTPLFHTTDVHVSGDRVGWRHETLSGYVIVTWTQASGLVTITPTPIAACQAMTFDGSRFAWMQTAPSTPAKLYTWKVGDAEPTLLSSNINTTAEPRVSGDRVIWVGADGLVYVASHAEYFLHYLTGTGGWLSGVASQTVAGGSDGTTVTALPYPGYMFSIWSPGATPAARCERAVAADATYTANFARTDVATLRSIRPSAGKLSAAFSKTRGSYTDTIKASAAYSVISVATTKSTSKVRFKIDGGRWSAKRTAKASLKVPVSRGKSKTLYVEVTSSGGVVNTYRVMVRRKS